MRPVALCVLGMHRSGTSALSGALGLLGVKLGRSLLPPQADNPAGFWEHREIVASHERLLAALDHAWDDVRPLPPSWWRSGPAARCRQEIGAVLRREFAGAPAWAVKDPRMCRLAPLWLQLLDEADCEPAFILIHRHPLEVADSLARRDGMDRARAALLWVGHNLEAEHATRGRRRVLLSYDQLLDEPRPTLERVAKGAGLAPLADGAMDRAASFLSARLRHHVRRGADGFEAELGHHGALAAATYGALSAACRGEAAPAGFDAAREAYEQVLAAFDPALAGHVGALHRQVRDLEASLAEVQESRSWRLTRSLRWAGTLARRLLPEFAPKARRSEPS